jgi:tRNA dimethylallyltransferase
MPIRGSARAGTPPVIVVAGPTGSGKSALALDLAMDVAGTIINADSMQVYRELRLLTARPSAEDESRVPHRLFGVLSAAEPCSAGRWLRLAIPEIRAAREAGRIPIVVGGTGLYLKALLQGLAEVPEIPAAAIAEARALHARLGGAAFRERLIEIDPVGGARLRASDSQRLIRAYAVASATGRSLTDWQKASPSRPALTVHFAVIALMPPRVELNTALDTRFGAMIAQGALDEVKALDALGLDPSLPVLKAVGVPELRRHLRGDSTLPEAIKAAQQSTRDFAKRQMTWLRHQLAPDMAIPARYGPDWREEVIDFAKRVLVKHG